MGRFLNIKLCALLALFGLMLVGCNSDLDKEKMNLTFETTVTGDVAKTTHFRSADGDAQDMLRRAGIHNASATDTCKSNKPTRDSMELTCTANGGTVRFYVKSNIDSHVPGWFDDDTLTDRYDDILVNNLSDYIIKSAEVAGENWMALTDSWEVNNDWWD